MPRSEPWGPHAKLTPVRGKVTGACWAVWLQSWSAPVRFFWVDRVPSGKTTIHETFSFGKPEEETRTERFSS